MRIFIVIFIIAVVLAVLWLLIGFYGFRVAMGRGKDMDIEERRKIRGSSWDVYYDEIRAGMDWISAQEKEAVSIVSDDGLKLYGNLILHPQARGTVILFHGYRTSGATDFSASSENYYNLGFNLLHVDQRACERSEGKYVTFGIRERFDCLRWVEYVSGRFGKDSVIFLGGLSMGASTVLMASGAPLPENVRGLIVDCPFDSPKNIIGRTIRTRYHVSPKLLFPAINLWSRLLAGVSLTEYSTQEAMEANRTPILFAHGKADNYVPCEMTVKTYEACRAPKELFLVEGAGHGVSFLIEPEEYKKKIAEFVEAHIGGNGKQAENET